jgi:hypothetical protein
MSTQLAPWTTDPTAGMELVTGEEVALDATRWLFLAGDLLSPDHRDDNPETRKGGGEEIQNFCLRRTPNFVERGKFTPLEVWGEFMAKEYLPDGYVPLKLKGEKVEDGGISNPFILNGKPLYAYMHYPGNLIMDAIGLPTGEKRGIVELKPLLGLKVEDAEPYRIHAAFFPEGFLADRRLSVMEQRIRQVAAESSDLKAIADDMLQSCEQFRRYAEMRISRQHTQLDQRVTHQYVHSYSPTVLSLMEQLEIKPRSHGSDLNAELLKAVSSSGLTPEVFSQMADRDEKLVEKLSAAFAEAMGQALKSIAPKPTK